MDVIDGAVMLKETGFAVGQIEPPHPAKSFVQAEAFDLLKSVIEAMPPPEQGLMPLVAPHGQVEGLCEVLVAFGEVDGVDGGEFDFGWCSPAVDECHPGHESGAVVNLGDLAGVSVAEPASCGEEALGLSGLELVSGPAVAERRVGGFGVGEDVELAEGLFERLALSVVEELLLPVDPVAGPEEVDGVRDSDRSGGPCVVPWASTQL